MNLAQILSAIINVQILSRLNIFGDIWVLGYSTWRCTYTVDFKILVHLYMSSALYKYSILLFHSLFVVFLFFVTLNFFFFNNGICFWALFCLKILDCNIFTSWALECYSINTSYPYYMSHIERNNFNWSFNPTTIIQFIVFKLN